MEQTDTEDWTVIESKSEYETGWFTGGYDRVVQPDGSTKRYYWADLPPAVVIVARATASTVRETIDPSVTPEEGPFIVFVEQYRPTIRRQHLELPAGIVESEETFAEAGARELEEETGLATDTVTTIQTYAVATGVLRHTRGVVVAEDLRPGTIDRDGNEFLTPTAIPEAEAITRAREPPVNDSTISALLLAKEDGYIDP